MTVTRAEVLKLVRTARGHQDGHQDGHPAKPRKYYNKYNKENKDNKHNVFTSSVGSPAAQVQKKDLNPSEEIIKDFEKKKETEIVSYGDEIDWLKVSEIKQASVQLYLNQKTRRTKERRIIKLQIETPLDGYVDYIATLTNNTDSLNRFNDRITEKHREMVLQEAATWKAAIKADHPRSKVYIGKFRETSGDSFTEGLKGNMPIEEATIAIVWYDTIHHNWQFHILFQNWIHNGTFETDQLTEKQKETNMIGKHMYYPELRMKKLSRTERRRQARLKLESEE